MILLKSLIKEIEDSSSIEHLVSSFESHTNSKYKDAIKTFMVYYNKNKKSLELTDLYLKPEYYGKGIGTQIMTDLIKFADSLKLPIILIPESERGSNKKLIDFYKKFGFVLNKGRKADYVLSTPLSMSMYRLPN